MLERLERWRAMRGGEDGGRGRSLMVCLGFTIRKWNMFYSTVKINLFMFRFPPLIVEPPQRTVTTPFTLYSMDVLVMWVKNIVDHINLGFETKLMLIGVRARVSHHHLSTPCACLALRLYRTSVHPSSPLHLFYF
jgi:hypothetical protein